MRDFLNSTYCFVMEDFLNAGVNYGLEKFLFLLVLCTDGKHLSNKDENTFINV